MNTVETENKTEQKWNLKEHVKYHWGRVWNDVRNLFKWLLLAVMTGVIVGVISCLFAYALTAVTVFRENNNWVFLCLPLAGLCIAFLYDKYGKGDGGANQVFSTVRSKDNVRFRAAPLIFISTSHYYEIDFLISQGDKISAIEVKSSGTGKHESLTEFGRKYSKHIKESFILSQKDIGKEGTIWYTPIYLTPFVCL